MISYRSTRECRRGLERYKASNTKRNMLKEAVAAEEEMRKVREEINKKRGALSALVEKVIWQSDGSRRFGKNFRTLQAMVEGKGSFLPPKPTTAALMRWRSSCSLWESRMRGNGSKFSRTNSSEDSKSQRTCANARKRSRRRE